MKRFTAFLLACIMVFTAGDFYAMAAAAEGGAPLVDYVIVDEPMIETPGTQRVMVGIGGGLSTVEEAVLSYRSRQTGQTFETKAKEYLEGFVLFEMEYQDESLAGAYELCSISYTADGTHAFASFAEMGIEAAYGVNQTVENEPDDVLLTDEDIEALTENEEMDVVAFDEEGNYVTGRSIGEALIEADGGEAYLSARRGAKGVDATGMKSLVVVLDAGHGGSDPGAQANGVVEKIVNLKIAQYCKAELEEYSGVIVYMTRNTDTYLSLAQRAQVAIDKKADVFVSLHNNSNTSSVPCGANVYYPNSNYNAGCGATGQALASVIESKLTDLGLANGGIHIRNSENGTKYPDGSLADYYGVIKRCKENGIPALIVEHAFISNASDAQNYLSTDAQLKKLGIADASGIAEYFGLNKGLGFNSIQSKSGTTMDLTWTPVVGVSGYCISRSHASGSGFEEVAKITSASTTSWRDTGLVPGQTYYYKIRAYTQSGQDIKYGKYSSVASGTTMESPAISSIKSKNSKELVISWSTVNSASNYEIYRATKKKGTYKKITTVTGVNRMNYTDKNLKPGKKYFYKIRSIGQVDNSTVYSEYSDPMCGRTAVIPTEVSVKSQATDTLRVSWKAEANAAGYVIKRASSLNGKYKKVGTVKDGTKTYYDDAGVKANTTYYYKVQSYNYNDKIKGVSGFGKPASGKTIKKTAITEIITNSPTSQTIRWKKADGIDGYIIYQSTSKNGTYKKLKKVSAKKTSYKATKLKPGVRYYYKIRTRKKVNGKVGYGSYSTIRNAWIPNPPQITAVLGSTANSVEVFWNPISGAESFTVYRSTTQDGSYEQLVTLPGSAVSYIDKGLNMGSPYFYKVEAVVKSYKTTAKSGLSNAMGAYPVRKTNITSVAANAQGVLEVAWNPILDAQGYRVYRSTELNANYTLLAELTGASVANYADPAAERNVTYYYKIVPVGLYNGAAVYGDESPAVSGMLPAAP